MGSSIKARQLAVPLRACRELDIIGDVSVTIDTPASSSPGPGC